MINWYIQHRSIAISTRGNTYTCTYLRDQFKRIFLVFILYNTELKSFCRSPKNEYSIRGCDLDQLELSDHKVFECGGTLISYMHTKE